MARFVVKHSAGALAGSDLAQQTGPPRSGHGPGARFRIKGGAPGQSRHGHPARQGDEQQAQVMALAILSSSIC
jgi:hypothetical protein